MLSLRSSGLLVAAAIAVATPGYPQPSFERIVGTGDPVPEAPPGTVFWLPYEPHTAGDWVVFSAFSGIGRGVYAWDGFAFHRVVDETMPAPGGGGWIVPWADVGEVDVNADGRIVFVAQDAAGYGIGEWAPGDGMSWLYPPAAPSPLGPGPFEPQGPRFLGDDVLVVHVSIGGPDVRGVVRFPLAGGAVAATEPATQVWPPRTATHEGSFVFGESNPDRVQGLWQVGPGSSPELLLQRGIPLVDGLPGEVWNGFVGGLLRFGLGGVVFRGGGDLGTHGVYRVIGPGQWEKIYEHGDIEPRTGLPIELSPEHNQSASANRLVFVVRTDQLTYHLLLREPDGTLVNLISTGDMLDGEVASRFYLTTKAMPDDNTVYVEIDRESETAIWRIGLEPLGGPNPLEIPSTSGIGLAAMVALLAAVAVVRLVRR